MFFILYDTVFPWLGYFFGCVAGIAESDFTLVMNWLAPFVEYQPISCTNLFTGDVFYLANELDWLSTLLAPVRYIVTLLFSAFGLDHLPFWIAILIFVGSLSIVISIIKFIKDLVT